MLNIDIDEARERFAEKLKTGHFTLTKSQNYEDDYSKKKEQRDTQAVVEFFDTDLADEIRQMK